MMKIGINLATQPFRRDRPVLVAAPQSPEAQAFRDVAKALRARLGEPAAPQDEAPKKPQGLRIKFFGR